MDGSALSDGEGTVRTAPIEINVHDPAPRRMSTSYRITIGYNSSAGSEHELGQKLAEEAIAICRCYSLIFAEAKRFISETPEKWKELQDYTMVYGTIREQDGKWYGEEHVIWSTEDLTCQITRSKEGEITVFQMASGGGEIRKMKELCRRAFCRVLIAVMHGNGIEVNLQVS